MTEFHDWLMHFIEKNAGGWHLIGMLFAFVFAVKFIEFRQDGKASRDKEAKDAKTPPFDF